MAPQGWDGPAGWPSTAPAAQAATSPHPKRSEELGTRAPRAHLGLATDATLWCKLTPEKARGHVHDKLEAAGSREAPQSHGSGSRAGAAASSLLPRPSPSGTAPPRSSLWADTGIMTRSFLCRWLLARQTKRRMQELTIFIHSISSAGF